MRKPQTRSLQAVLRNRNLVTIARVTDSAGVEFTFKIFQPCPRLLWREQRIIGKRFGRLTVIEMLPSRGTNTGVYFHCGCDCGGEATVRAKDLPNGNTVSCGCRRAELLATPPTFAWPKGVPRGPTGPQKHPRGPRGPKEKPLHTAFVAKLNATIEQLGANPKRAPLIAEFRSRGVSKSTINRWFVTALKQANG